MRRGYEGGRECVRRGGGGMREGVLIVGNYGESASNNYFFENR